MKKMASKMAMAPGVQDTQPCGDEEDGLEDGHGSLEKIHHVREGRQKLSPGLGVGIRRRTSSHFHQPLRWHPTPGIEGHLVNPATRHEELLEVVSMDDGGTPVQGFARRLEDPRYGIEVVAQRAVCPLHDHHQLLAHLRIQGTG
jgi:hypothetical protein